MANILDYLDWRGDLTFEQSAFNDVDNLILSQLVYIDFDEAITAEGQPPTLLAAAKELLRLHPGGIEPRGLMLKKPMNQLLKKAAVSKRFGGMLLTLPHSRIDSDSQEQFYALTFVLGNGEIYVAFRGTDQTLVGWKEDFNMGFICPVPSQPEAVNYLKSAAFVRPEKIITGGHSKGGNLAVYSAAFAKELSGRITRVYNNDGPGFPREVVEKKEFVDILPKIISIVPQGSVVGMLLEHREAYSVVKSLQKGILQHDGFSWEVRQNRFVELRSRSTESLIIDSTLTEWMNNMNSDERETFVSALYEILSVSGAKTLAELSGDALKLIRNFRNLNPKTREILSAALRELTEQAKRSAREVAARLKNDGADIPKPLPSQA